MSSCMLSGNVPSTYLKVACTLLGTSMSSEGPHHEHATYCWAAGTMFSSCCSSPCFFSISLPADPWDPIAFPGSLLKQDVKEFPSSLLPTWPPSDHEKAQSFLLPTFGESVPSSPPNTSLCLPARRDTLSPPEASLSPSHQTEGEEQPPLFLFEVKLDIRAKAFPIPNLLFFLYPPLEGSTYCISIFQLHVPT